MTPAEKRRLSAMWTRLENANMDLAEATGDVVDALYAASDKVRDLAVQIITMEAKG